MAAPARGALAHRSAQVVFVWAFSAAGSGAHLVKRVAIVGCGLVGTKRSRVLGPHALIAAADANLERAQRLAEQSAGCQAYADWRAVIDRRDVDIVIVATTNQFLAPVTLAAVQAGKHVLVEKPAARRAAELEPIVRALGADTVVKVGFNHRFHPALQKARAIFDSGDPGPLLFIRGRYGHGGRLGYEREWRADREIAGGGELLDQGVHLIDLARWFAGEFTAIAGHVATYFWEMPVEDNGFAMLRTAAGHLAWLHASCTEWKNLFSFEIVCSRGKLQIDGLGGSYGVERLTYYRMKPEMGPPITTAWEYPDADMSWAHEFADFIRCIDERQRPCGDLTDALAVLRVVDELYRQSGRQS